MRLLTALLLLFLSPAAVLADATLGTPLHVDLPDGTVADSQQQCGAGDLCGTLKFTNGDSIQIYSEGAAKCQPYKLKVLRLHGDTTILSYDAETRMITKNNDWSLHFSANSCRFQDTYLVVDDGRVQMGVFQNQDGSLSVRFASTSTGETATAAPTPLSP